MNSRTARAVRGPKNPVPGRDVAGTVEALGARVTRFAVGDEVYGVAPGSFAEYAAADEDKLARKPVALSFAQAAVVPISAGTALQALQDVGKVQPGQSVLVLGASGGVGSYAVQLAKGFGAEVTGVCSTAKVEFVADGPGAGADLVRPHVDLEALVRVARRVAGEHRDEIPVPVLGDLVRAGKDPSEVLALRRQRPDRRLRRGLPVCRRERAVRRREAVGYRSSAGGGGGSGDDAGEDHQRGAGLAARSAVAGRIRRRSV